jgi:Ciliary basal body-associated, B9 protein
VHSEARYQSISAACAKCCWVAVLASKPVPLRSWTHALHSQVFYILADWGWDQDAASEDDEHQVLLRARAFADGTIELCPPVATATHDFNMSAQQAACTYKLQDKHGGLYEYTISILNSSTCGSKLLERKDELWRAYEQMQLQQAKASMAKFWHPNDRQWHLVGEIVSAQGFSHDRLYIEFALRYDKRLWRLIGPEWLIQQHMRMSNAFGDELVEHVRPDLSVCIALQGRQCTVGSPAFLLGYLPARLPDRPPACASECLLAMHRMCMQISGCTHISGSGRTRRTGKAQSVQKACFAHPLEFVLEQLGPKLSKVSAEGSAPMLYFEVCRSELCCLSSAASI